MRIRDLDASQFSRLSALLDEALGLAPREQEAWLAGIGDAESAALLRQMLTAHAGVDAWLDTRGALDRQLAGLADDQQSLAGRRFGAYRVVSLLGHGGMGSVWLAERADGLFNRRVALKLLHPAVMGRGVSERFAREREILAGLEHPNIARLLEAGVAEDGQPYLALQYVEGVPITAYCDRHCLSIRERLQLFLQVVAAVQYAHAHLVIHRDLKPSNILVTEESQVQLLDFGIAKLLTAEAAAQETELTRLGGRALTPEYAAPEQVAGAPVTTATDVYSLGVVLYELLTGIRPYRLTRESRGALEDAIVSADPVKPSQAISNPEAAAQRAGTVRSIRAALHGALDIVVLTALKKRPAERYEAVAALGEDLRRHLRNEPILARSESAWSRARKFLRRNRLPVAAGTLTAAALVAGLGVALWEAHVARYQAARAAEISGFIGSVFQQADTSENGYADIRAVDLLLRARERIQQELRGRNALQVELLCIVASSLYSLGDNDQAGRTFESARALAGDPSLVPHQCSNDYADLLVITGDYRRANEVLTLVEREESALPPSVATGKTLQTRANLELNLNRRGDALQHAREGSDIIRRVTPPGSSESLQAMLYLAQMSYHADEDALALATVDQALAEHEAHADATRGAHGTVLLLQSLRARALSETGRSEEAAQAYAELLPQLRETFGDRTHQYSVDAFEYSKIERRLGRLKHAIALCEESLAAAKAGRSSDMNVAHILLGLAIDLLAARQIQDGSVRAAEALAVANSALSADDPERFSYRAVSAWARGLQGDSPDSARELRTLVEARRARDPKSPFIPTALGTLGEVYVRASRYQDAAAVLIEAERLTPPARNYLLPAMNAALGTALLEIGRLDEAATRLQAALTGEGVSATATPAQADAHLGLARVLLSRGEHQAALQHLAAADDFWRDFDPDNSARREVAAWRARVVPEAGHGAVTTARGHGPG